MSPSKVSEFPKDFGRLEVEDRLWKIAVLMKGIEKLDPQSRVQKFRTMAMVLRDLIRQRTKAPLEGLEQIMAEICKCMPHADKLGKSISLLGDVAGMNATLAFAHMSGEVQAGAHWDESAAQWVVEKFIQDPFKYAQKRAGGAHLCFPVINSIASAFSDWREVCGVHQATRYCLKSTTRIMQQDRLTLQGKEGFGILGNCLCVLGENVGMEQLEKLLDWAIDGVKKSTSWETRYWAICFLQCVTQIPFSPIDDIALILKGKERTIHQVLRNAQRDSNLKVRDMAYDVYDIYKRLWTRYIPSVSPTPEPQGLNLAGGLQGGGMPPISEVSEKIANVEGDLPPEFYANLYRGKITKDCQDPRMPNTFDIKSLEKHRIWDIEPNFNPHAYDWSNWEWPIEDELVKLLEALRTGDGGTEN
ncbi:hypothetical protein BSKO_08173 [Bryopsis sp. KO-2023]|nr:hypothetical protein BSKO_08173 [Bryopsis sp. KO-2023]